MNKIACAIMVSLSGTCFLKGEIAPPETEWKGARLIYEGVSIQNEVTLPQKGVMYHDEDKLSFNITNATIEMTTSLSKKPMLIYEDRSLTVTTIPLRHRMPCCGFLFRRDHLLRADLQSSRLV